MKSGYYWVKWKKNAPWVVIEYMGSEGWVIPSEYDGTDGSFFAEPAVIGPHITPPDNE